MKTLKIKVTNNEIKNGKWAHPCLCPIALAIKNTLGIDNANVTHSEIVFYRYGTKSYKTPIKVKRFIHMFDMGKKVKPMSFNLVEE